MLSKLDQLRGLVGANKPASAKAPPRNLNIAGMISREFIGSRESSASRNNTPISLNPPQARAAPLARTTGSSASTKPSGNDAFARAKELAMRKLASKPMESGRRHVESANVAFSKPTSEKEREVEHLGRVIKYRADKGFGNVEDVTTKESFWLKKVIANVEIVSKVFLRS